MNDDDYGRLLLRPLAVDPPEPSRVDVARAMRDGRRMRRRLRWAGLTGLLAAVTALVTGNLLLAPLQQNPPPVLPPDPAVPTSCTATQLPMGDWKSAELTGGDAGGRWLLGNTEPVYGGDNRLLVWHDRKLVGVADRKHAGIQMRDVNSSGVAVGFREPGADLPYAYHDGTFIPLKGGEGMAVAINDAGVIAGVVTSGNSAIPRVARWAYPGAEPEVLAGSDGRIPIGQVLDVEPDGTVIGFSGATAYEWLPDGTVRPVPLPGLPGTRGVGPVAFRNGWLYALVSTEAPTHTAAALPASPDPEALYRYEPRSRTWQPVADGLLNAQIAGIGFAVFAQTDPAVWIGPRTFKLPSSFPPSVPADDAIKIDVISDDARVIAGTAMSSNTDPNAPSLPIVWQCR